MNSTLNNLRRKIKNALYSMDYLPRWMVFFIDIFLTVISCEISYLIVRALHVKFYDTLDVPTRYGIIVLINIIFFIVFKTYSGIIRYSTFIDALKLLYSTISTFFVLAVINYSSYYFIGKKIYLFPSLIINFIITFSALFLFRIFVKIVFENINLLDKNTESLKAVVYGADANAISVVTALQSEKTRRFQIVGFIEKKNNYSSKRILNIPILSSKKKVSVVLRSFNAQVLILADNSLTNEEKIKIVEDCLESNIKVYNSGAITDWENQEAISKKIIEFKIEDLLNRSTISLDQEPISTQLNEISVLITGAAGSIGKLLVLNQKK